MTNIYFTAFGTKFFTCTMNSNRKKVISCIIIILVRTVQDFWSLSPPASYLSSDLLNATTLFKNNFLVGVTYQGVQLHYSNLNYNIVYGIGLEWHSTQNKIMENVSHHFIWISNLFSTFFCSLIFCDHNSQFNNTISSELPSASLPPFSKYHFRLVLS